MKCASLILIMNLILALLLVLPHVLVAEVGEADLNDASKRLNAVKINKCCENNEVMVNSVCRLAKQYNQTVWVPKFKTDDGKDATLKNYNFVNGMPQCETTQVLYAAKTEDKLHILVDGRLRHFFHHKPSSESIKEEITNTSNLYSLHENIPIPEDKEPPSYTHDQNKYCMDKIIFTNSNNTGEYALLCIPEAEIN